MLCMLLLRAIKLLWWCGDTIICLNFRCSCKLLMLILSLLSALAVSTEGRWRVKWNNSTVMVNVVSWKAFHLAIVMISLWLKHLKLQVSRLDGKEQCMAYSVQSVWLYQCIMCDGICEYWIFPNVYVVAVPVPEWLQRTPPPAQASSGQLLP